MIEQTPTKLLSKGLISITMINLIIYLIYYLLTVIIAVAARDSLHATLGRMGLASGTYIIGTLLAQLLTGKLLELIERRQVSRYGALLYLLATVAYMCMSSMGIPYLVRFLNGFNYGTASTATNAIITTYIPKSKKGEGINYYGLSTSSTTGIGPFVGMLLLNISNFHVIIDFSIILILLTTIVCSIFPVKNIELTPEYREALSKWDFDGLVEKKILFIIFIALLMDLAYSSVLSFLSPYVRVIDLVDVSTFFFIVHAVVTTLTCPSTGRIFDVKNERYVMYPSYTFSALGLFLLSMTTSGWTLLASGGLVGLGYGTFVLNGRAVYFRESPGPHRAGIALLIYFIGLDLGLGVGPYVSGGSHNFISSRQVYFLAGYIPIVCTILYMVFHEAENDTKDLPLGTIGEIEHGSEL